MCIEDTDAGRGLCCNKHSRSQQIGWILNWVGCFLEQWDNRECIMGHHLTWCYFYAVGSGVFFWKDHRVGTVKMRIQHCLGTEILEKMGDKLLFNL